MKRIARLLMLASLAAAIPAHAATFVKDVMLIGGNNIYMHAPTAHSPLGLTVNGLDIAYASGTVR